MDQFWEALSAGPLRHRAAEMHSPGRAAISQRSRGQTAFTPNDYFEPKDAGVSGPFRAVRSGRGAGRDPRQRTGAEGEGHSHRHRLGLGGKATEDEGYCQLYRDNNTRFNPLTIPRAMANAAASRISLEYGITGAGYTVPPPVRHPTTRSARRSGWCAAARRMSPSPAAAKLFSVGLLQAWEAMRVVSPDTCRPFSKSRGLISGDGAAMMVLEPLDAARARGARIYAEIVGFGMSSDAHHITQPLAGRSRPRDARGARRWRTAPGEIGYINAHGTGTQANDTTEPPPFAASSARTPTGSRVSSTKSMHGHTLGAAGAIEGAATLLAMTHGIIPPTANYEDPDPSCDLDIVPNTARAAEVEYAVSNSFAFGGLNAVVVFRRV